MSAPTTKEDQLAAFLEAVRRGADVWCSQDVYERIPRELQERVQVGQHLPDGYLFAIQTRPPRPSYEEALRALDKFLPAAPTPGGTTEHG